jgi:F420-0:gamma-glutamyl ligase-like protein
MVKYKALAVTTRYWRPRENFLEQIVRCIEGRISDGDFVVLSEKAISTAKGNIVNERLVEPSINSRLIAKYWMQVIWGYILGPLCHFQERLLRYVREYPVEMGSRHKQVALQYAGLFQALMFGSEGGIDGSNLAYAYVSLPLSNADEIAEKIRKKIQSTLKKRVSVIIVDTDKTYSFRNLYFTPRPTSLKGIHSLGAFFAYVIGRLFKLKNQPTPVALAGFNVDVKETLRIADIANHIRGVGAGKTVWDMAERFCVDLAGVRWEMLETVRHKPIVLVRKKEV